MESLGCRRRSPGGPLTDPGATSQRSGVSGHTGWDCLRGSSSFSRLRFRPRKPKSPEPALERRLVRALNLTWPKVSASQMCAGPRSTPLLGPPSHPYPESIWKMGCVRNMGIFMGQESGRSWAWWWGAVEGMEGVWESRCATRAPERGGGQRKTWAGGGSQGPFTGTLLPCCAHHGLGRVAAWS